MFFDHTKLCHFALTSLILTLSGCGGKAGPTQTSPVTAASVASVTSVGTDFYLTLPDHLCVSDNSSCNNLPVANKLIIAASAATSGEITFNNVVTPFSVMAGNQAVITLDAGVVLTSNELVEAKGIHITALSPVSVYVVSENATSADGYLALPTAGLGTSYYVMSRSSSRYSGSEFAVVASRNATTLNITPSASGASKAAGVAFTVLLNAGDTYQFANTGSADMTGTLITSDQPVAVFGGHRCADVPSGVGYCDYLVEQLPDTSAWGNTFHTAPFSGRSRYTVRVLASQDNTTFATIPAGLLGTLNAGQFADVDLTTAAEIISSNPVLVAQFMRGYADDIAAKGDPSMVLITPAEMGMTESTFAVHGLAGTSGAFISIVTESSSLGNLTLDSAVVDPALFTPLGGNSNYSFATIPVPAGTHTLLGTAAYSAHIYDYGIAWNAVSYAYPVGRMLSVPVSTITPTLPPVCDEEDDEDEDEHDDECKYEHTSSSLHHHHRNKRGHDHRCHHHS
ncbi:MAG: IgGFc-binding protein [Gallionellaceae bacterium]|jgi:hypothetical protein